MQIVIFGAGKKVETVLSCLKKDIKVVCIVDHDSEKIGGKYKDSIEIKDPRKLSEIDFDAIVVSVMRDETIEEELRATGLIERTVFFWRDEQNLLSKKIFKNRIKIAFEEAELFQARLDSAPYEWGLKESPHILDGEILLKKMISDYSSLCRYGDGEFEIMMNRDRDWYQKKDKVLSQRLREIITCSSDKINIAIAQDFILERYTESAADGIRIYMCGEIRKQILQMLSDDCKYYDAFVSRPYLLYRNRENADRIFPLFKELWENRKVCIVEGILGRFGIGSNLLDGAFDVVRVACPATGAWDCYDRIRNYIEQNISKDYLILISLGPAATVMAYDLANEGYQAVDIGQLDNEYDWYLRGAKRQIPISGKMVAEYNFSLDEVQQDDAVDKTYKEQLIKVIDGNEI